MMIEQSDEAPLVRWAWGLALAVVALAGTLVTSCMMPFVALGVIAAATLPLRQAIPTILLAWAGEQAIGFGLLGYPWDAHAMGWGVAIGAASLIVALAAYAAGATRGWPRTIAIFPGGFILYEALLFAYAVAGGGTEAFTPAIVGALARNETLWLLALLVLRESLRLLLPSRLVPRPVAA